MIPQSKVGPSTATIVRDEVPGPTPVRQVPEYQTVLLSLEPKEKDLASASKASLVRWAPGLVVQVEGPIHVSEAARRIYAAADITRSSKRVQSAVNEAVDHLVTAGRLKAWWLPVKQRHDPAAGSGSVRASRCHSQTQDGFKQRIGRGCLHGRGTSVRYRLRPSPSSRFQIVGIQPHHRCHKNRSDSVVSSLLSDGRLEDYGGLLVMAEASDG